MVGGFLAFTGSIILIYLRGYLVPGTPKLTKQYFPLETLRWIEKELIPIARSHLNPNIYIIPNGPVESAVTKYSDNNRMIEVDSYNYFLKEDILEVCRDGNDLCLTDQFKVRWHREMEQFYDTNLKGGEIASVIGVQVNHNRCEIKRHGEERLLLIEQKMVGRWPSYEALIADVGAAHVLDEYSRIWNTYSPNQKGIILDNLRLFIEQCPDGSGSVSMKQETIETCCSSQDIITIRCDSTGARVFERPTAD
ncbi:hypothetical protein [Halomarina pelagica]|uniref:hypothetical protein n=1 Tax=Halomarina pelagica TaxID=2961599 RepID=UPI0020C3922A|nr:hypothetical protein [Halomarina sp. BND7]